MLHIKHVNTKENQQVDGTEEFRNGFIYGTNTFIYLVNPLKRKSDHIVCAKLFFASVELELEMKHMGLLFIVAVKTVYRNLSVDTFSQYEFTDRRQSNALMVHDNDGSGYMIEFFWINRERRNFITTCSLFYGGAT